MSPNIERTIRQGVAASARHGNFFRYILLLRISRDKAKRYFKKQEAIASPEKQTTGLDFLSPPNLTHSSAIHLSFLRFDDVRHAVQLVNHQPVPDLRNRRYHVTLVRRERI